MEIRNAQALVRVNYFNYEYLQFQNVQQWAMKSPDVHCTLYIISRYTLCSRIMIW